MMMQSLATGPQASMLAADIHPYEAAWLAARIVVVGEIQSFSADAGASMRVADVIRGTVDEPVLRLCGTAHTAFLDQPGTQLVAFIDRVEESCARLLFPVGAGGLIWAQTSMLQAIVAAHQSPRAALKSADDRTRLAAAYFLLAEPGAYDVKAERKTVVSAALWGLEQDNPETNQAALFVLEKLGVPVGNYHPNYRLEIKRDAARDLRRRLADNAT
jgi:hypothetical protein